MFQQVRYFCSQSAFDKVLRVYILANRNIFFSHIWRLFSCHLFISYNDMFTKSILFDFLRVKLYLTISLNNDHWPTTTICQICKFLFCCYWLYRYSGWPLCFVTSFLSNTWEGGNGWLENTPQRCKKAEICLFRKTSLFFTLHWNSIRKRDSVARWFFPSFHKFVLMEKR